MRTPENSPKTSPENSLLARACARALGDGENSQDLALLAAFRSGYIARLPEGREVLEEQALIDRRLVSAARALRPALTAIVWAYVNDRMTEAASLVRLSRLDGAHELLAELRMTLAAALLKEDGHPRAEQACPKGGRPRHHAHCNASRSSRPASAAADRPPAPTPPKGATR